MESISFQLGHTYTRRQIHEAIGGSIQWYLPTRAKRVVCGCFTLEENPSLGHYLETGGEAIDVVVGTGPIVILTAEMLSRQIEPIPVFVKRTDNSWQYVGEYALREYATDRNSLEPYLAHRPDAVGVLRLHRTSNLAHQGS